MTRRRRGLSAEERTLWDAVARTAVPLRAEDAPRAVEPPPEAPAEEMLATIPPPSPEAKSATARKEPPPLSPIERRVLSRVARGTVGIDGRIDLHGLSQHEAHLTLKAYLVAAQARGARIILVITGKGMRNGSRDERMHAAHFGEAERGILRRRVPQWLAEPGLRDIVLGFEEAHRSHGGGGALYVRIRRRREAAAPGSRP